MKKLIRGMIITVGVFAVCAVAVTYAFILRAQTTGKEENLENPTPTAALTETPVMPSPVAEQPTSAPAERGIDLDGTYDANDLLIQTVYIPRTDEVEIEVPQLDGLKDLELQEKINQDIYNRVDTLLQEFPMANYGSYYVRANFANVLSISYHTGDGNRYGQLFLNYNLVTGERLKLEDLFLTDADITQCVRSAFYEMLARENMYTMDMDWESELTVYPDENRVYKMVKGYMESEEQLFMFSPAEICFYYGEYCATLRMPDNADQIAIYSRFLTEESIFTRDDIGFKNAFTCADTAQYDSFKIIEYGYLEPNFWYDITMWENYLESKLDEDKRERYNSLEKEYLASVEDTIETYRTLAKNNPDRFYMLFIKPYSHMHCVDDRCANVVELRLNGTVYEMPMEAYETSYRDKLIAAYRYVYFVMAGGAYIEWSEEEGVLREDIEETKAYNYITGEELTELEDLFYEDSGYMDVIRARTWDTLAWRMEYSEKEIAALVDTLECRLDGISILVTIPSLEDFYFSVVLGEFDDFMLKIYD